MIQVVALLAAGLAAVGVSLADSFALLVACWVLGTVLHAALVSAATASVTVREVAREVFLAEMFGAWVLLMSGLNLVLATGATSVAAAGPVAPSVRDLGWAGLGLLLVAAARLGLPPVGPWPARLAASPPVVRVFLHACAHPLTALVLWWRLGDWLLPWHRDLALGLGAFTALAAVVAAAGERQLPRRAALLTTGAWAGLLVLGTGDGPRPWPSLVAVTIAGMAMHVVAAAPRWSRTGRRGLLFAAAAAVAVAGLPLLDPRTFAGVVAVAARWAMVAALGASFAVLGHWWSTLATPEESVKEPRAPLVPALDRLARLGRQPGPLQRLAAATSGNLARAVDLCDRVVLDGVVEGLALLGLGAAWLVAWCDRRGLDAVERGLGALVLAAGRGSRNLAGARPAVVLLWLGMLVMALLLLGRSS
ncbi:MAG: hypothetical protein R3D98_01470 [Candidatus Krumholzibacteriia bacterium]